MKLDARTARLVVLATWAALFWWLRLTGEVARFIAPRNFWVVTFAAVVLTGLLVLAAVTQRQAEREWLSLREALGLVALLAPVLVVLVSSNAQLGSLAAANKLGSRGIDLAALPHTAPGDPHITFLALDLARRHADVARADGIAPGRRVTMTGFVLGGAAIPGRQFNLGRFYIWCCVADAVALQVKVVPPATGAAYPKDQWLDVDGRLERRAGKLVVVATRLRPVSAPTNPYGSFS